MPDALRVLPELARKQEGRTVIAHLSDLHFRAQTNPASALWSALAQDLGSREGRRTIDLVVATGDLIDGSVTDDLAGTFDHVRRFLYALCDAADVSHDALFVVPGNHDVRAQGIFSSKAQAKLFSAAFGDHFQHAHLPNLRAFLFPFDSNTSVSPLELAAGSVREESFPRFAALVGAAAATVEWQDCARIALVHHHPMPIAATEHRGFENLEEYLLLRNAGMFMTEIVRRDFDLILHGHKHYPAMSRATFIDDDGRARSVAVVAAGSAGAASPSYNLLTLHDGGRIEVERRERPAGTYVESSRESVHLVPYDEARRRRCDRLVKSSTAPLHVRSHEKISEIRAASGDVWVRELIVGARIRQDDPVEHIPARLSSDSAYINTPIFDPPSRVRWEWTKENAEEGWREGTTVFTPPLGPDERLTWRRTTHYANAIYFSKQDRLDATDQETDRENNFHRVQQVCDRITLAVTFPKHCLPDSIRIEVRDRNNVRDAAEEAHCAERLTRIENSRTYVLSLEKPLPHYSYDFVWDLPDVDPAEPRLVGQQANHAIAARDFLVSHDPHDTATVVAALDALRRGFAVYNELKKHDTDDLDVTCFVYRPEKHGLAVQQTTAAANDPIRTRVIKSGREVAGQAWRRRKPMVFVAESVDNETGQALQHDGQVAVVGIPLFYPVKTGRRVAVVSLASRSRLTWLTLVDRNPAMVEWVTDEVWQWWRAFLRQEVGLTDVKDQ